MSKTTTKPGPKSKVTRHLVKRVSRLVAKGISIRVALEGEPVTQHAYERHLRRHPELAAIQRAAKLKFLERAIDVIVSRPSPYLRWLLERRYSDIFGPNHKDEENDDLNFETTTENTSAAEAIKGGAEASSGRAVAACQ